MAGKCPDATILTEKTALRGHEAKEVGMSAQGSAAPPLLGADVHVTGRRILATIVDGLVFGGLYG
jgi:hypothetical protein